MSAAGKPFSLYIHIPYCISKCPYCDFNSHVVPEIPEKQYTEALLRELDHYGSRDEWQNGNVQSIFFGGGTPSTFKPTSIGKILARTAAIFPVQADCEITLEANPGTVDQENFFGYRDARVNRVCSSSSAARTRRRRRARPWRLFVMPASTTSAWT